MQIFRNVVGLAILLSGTVAVCSRNARADESAPPKQRRYAMMYAGPFDQPRQQTDPAYLRNTLEEFVKANLAVAMADSPVEREKLQQARLAVFRRLVEAELAASENPRAWIERLTDNLVSGQSAGEAQVLCELLDVLKDELRAALQPSLSVYVEFRELAVRYRAACEQPGADIAVQLAVYLANLNDFVDRYPTSADAAEALATIALAAENAGDMPGAIEWYTRLRDEFHKSRRGALAAGAIFRLSSEGQPVSFRISDLQQLPVDSTRLRGRNVVLHFWSPDSQPSIDALKQLSTLAKKLGDSQLRVIAIACGHDRAALKMLLKNNRVTATHVFEERGHEATLALQFGIVETPTTILIDPRGVVADIHVRIDQLGERLGQHARR